MRLIGSEDELTWHVSEGVLCRAQIAGRIYSKKNSSNIAVVKGRPMILGNPRYNATKNDYSEQLRQSSKVSAPLEGPISAWITTWGNNERWWNEWRSGERVIEKYSGWDCDNNLSAIFDLLTYSGLIHDDCQILDAHTRKLHGKRSNDTYGAEIILTRYRGEPWPS